MLFRPISTSDFSLPHRYESRQRHPFNDKRLYDQWSKLLKAQEQDCSCVVNRLAKDRAEAAGYYRFLSNGKVELKELIQMNCQIDPDHLKGVDVLCVGDTTSYNLKSHMGRIQDRERIGVLEDNKTPGFFSHVHLALNAQTQDVLGLADILLWCRPKSKGKTEKKAKPIKSSDKEAYKWLLGASNAKQVLGSAKSITYILDRDADSFELLNRLVEQGDHFVIRMKYNRQVEWQDEIMRLDQCLDHSPVLGSYELDLPALDHYSSTSGKRVRRQARKATIEVRCCFVNIQVPTTLVGTQAKALPLWVVQAKEVANTLAQGEELIKWNLLTTHQTEQLEQALTIIRFYLMRWMIEQLFRTMKSEGFEMEATELESFDAILRQTVMTYKAACRVLQLVYARNRFDSQPIDQVFNQEEQKVLKLITQRYEGKTEKQQNPFPPTQASWATWVIARIGGWKGYLSQKPPGPITLKRGLDKFAVHLETFKWFNSS